MIIDIACVALGYLLGSVSAAILVCRVFGLPDPRSQGSHNPGATNVMRLGGKLPAAITLAGDFLKGLLPVLLAQLVGAGDLGLALTALAAFLGHLYPVFFGFRGGKGVATAFGVILGLSPWVALLVLASWLAMAVLTRISSLSALTAAALAPVYIWWFDLPAVYVAAMLIMVLMLIWRHRSNIQRLLDGTESRMGKKG